jgi:hypothetical protein
LRLPVGVNWNPNWFQPDVVCPHWVVLSSGVCHPNKTVVFESRIMFSLSNSIVLLFGYENSLLDAVNFQVPFNFGLEFISHKCVAEEGTQHGVGRSFQARRTYI